MRILAEIYAHKKKRYAYCKKVQNCPYTTAKRTGKRCQGGEVVEVKDIFLTKTRTRSLRDAAKTTTRVPLLLLVLHSIDDMMAFRYVLVVVVVLVLMHLTSASRRRRPPEDAEISSMHVRISQLGETLGPDFLNAIAENQREHEADCLKSCELYYCATTTTTDEEADEEDFLTVSDSTTHIQSYSMGPVPPEDFGSDFVTDDDDALIRVTTGTPLFTEQEAAAVIETAVAEGVLQHEYQSGKYKLGGHWLDDQLPQTRAWFNRKLQTTFFPLLQSQFPNLIPSTTVLRAHSVSLLRYNASHPRTDIHIDNGLLALTVAMTPASHYQGGGTFFEHLRHGHDDNDNNNCSSVGSSSISSSTGTGGGVIPMDVGHATVRPGSVRHGGHRVTAGTRYVLGAFFLLQHRVEHVRRLKNRGARLRQQGQLPAALQHFDWALALNPSCMTCLKDAAEVLHRQGQLAQAETNIRKVLALSRQQDSDAWFTLGVLLSEQGRNDESITAYQRSFDLNPEDAELAYNLGLQLGAAGDAAAEMKMYAASVQADPEFGGAWLNWGTALAEQGNYDDAETMYLKALELEGVVAVEAMMNLGQLYQSQGEALATSGNLEANTAAEYLETAHTHLTTTVQQVDDMQRYRDLYPRLRLSCHRLRGGLHFAAGDMEAAEAEFRVATSHFDSEPAAWQMLGRVLQVQNKNPEEMAQIRSKLQELGATAPK